jgi:hypothetical protein
MFNKKTLSSAVAAATTGISLGKMLTVAGVAATAGGLSMGSMAQIDVTNTTAPGNVAIANESIAPTTTGTLPVGVGASGPLDVTGQLAVGIPNDEQIYMRFDWSSASPLGMVGGSNLVVGPNSVAGSSATVPSGDDLDGNEFAVIFGVTAGTAGFSQTAGFYLSVGTAGIELSGSSTDVRVRIYEEQSQALAAGTAGKLSDQTASGAVSLGDALSVSFSPETAIAEVTTNFTEFDNTGTTGELGSFTASANTSFVLATGLTPITTVDDLVNTGTSSVVTYTGDFSFATGSPNFYISSSTSGCSYGTDVSVETSAMQSATTTVAIANGFPLCVQVTGDEDIPETTYDADVVLVHDVTSSSPNVTEDSGEVGSIERNGTTVHVAYLTTFEDYNQRLIMNSRHPVPAMYTVTFKSENGTTCTGTDLASGMLPAHENLVIRVRDLVEVEGDSTRCSATVTVVAPDTNIDIATTQVNLSDGGTDTVVYN